ncbi:UNVERIFIED_CONTAM: hypothetical protein Sradi_1882400 [Sesamum radiatum]|uniref:Uncharacterized protein n=1 Tax=Sesamum radiatum TaxID=300843 RepID=A0AAW2TWS7_SESRA
MDDGLGEGAKDPPAYDILCIALNGSSNFCSNNGLHRGSTAAGVAGDVVRACLDPSEVSEALALGG